MENNVIWTVNLNILCVYVNMLKSNTLAKSVSLHESQQNV